MTTPTDKSALAAPLDIIHDAAHSRFECQVDGLRCVAEYRYEPNRAGAGGVLHMTHTVVPPALEGRGIAGALVKAALEHAREHGLKVDPQCSYVSAYMQRHPETQSLLA